MRAAQPFRADHRWVEIEPIAEEGALSGSAFRVVDDQGRCFKLRRCPRALRAWSIERYVRRLPGLFAPLVGRDREYLLFEILSEHRAISRRELLGCAEWLGGSIASLHAAGRGLIGRRASAWRYRFGFHQGLRALRKQAVLPPEVQEEIERRAALHERRFGWPIELELDDIHKGNVMWAPETDDLRYVDEEGIGLRVRGASLATLLKSASFSDPLEGFRVGYAAKGDASWIQPAYVEFLLLQDAVRRVAHKLRHETRLEKLPAELDEIRAIAESEGSDLGWRFPRDAVRRRRLAVRCAAGITAAAGFRVEIPEADQAKGLTRKSFGDRPGPERPVRGKI